MGDHDDVVLINSLLFVMDADCQKYDAFDIL